MAPSKLDDIEAIRTYLKQLIQRGRAEQALERLLDLLLRVKDAHTATTVRLYDALRKLYGRKSERLNPNQLELFVSELLKGPEGDEKVADNEPKKENKKRKPRGKQGLRGRQALPDNLPRRESEVMPEEEKCICECGEKKSIIGYETSEWLDFEPASVFVRKETRPKLSCNKCRDSVVCAPAGEMRIEGAMVGPGLGSSYMLSVLLIEICAAFPVSIASKKQSTPEVLSP